MTRRDTLRQYQWVSRSEFAAYSALCLIWSTTWLAIRIGVRYLPPIGFAGVRFLIAAAALLALLLIQPPQRPLARLPWRSLIATAMLTFVISYGLVFWCEQEVTAGFASLTFGSIPIFVALFARVLLQEPFTLRKSGGMLIGFLGLVVLFLDQIIGRAGSVAAGAGLLVAAAAGGASNVLVERDQQHVPPRLNATLQMLIGCAVLISLSAWSERHRSWTWNLPAVASVLFLALAGSALAFVLYYWLLHRVPATTASTIAFVAPFLTLLQGRVFLGESFAWNHVLGGLLIVAGSGLVLTARGGRRGGR